MRESAYHEEEHDEDYKNFRRNLLLATTKMMLPYLNEEQQRHQESVTLVDMIQQNKIDEAIAMVASKKKHLRTPEIFGLFMQHGPDVLRKYFNAIMRLPQPFTKWESMSIVEFILEDNASGRANLPLIALWVQTEKLSLSAELGEYLMKFSIDLALSVFLMLSIPDKVFECLRRKKRYDRIIAYGNLSHWKIDYMSLIAELKKESLFDALLLADLLATTPTPDSPVDFDQICKLLELEVRENDWDVRRVIKREWEKVKLEREAQLEEQRRRQEEVQQQQQHQNTTFGQPTHLLYNEEELTDFYSYIGGTEMDEDEENEESEENEEDEDEENESNEDNEENGKEEEEDSENEESGDSNPHLLD